MATATAVEIVQFAPESTRALAWFTALESGAKAQGIHVERSNQYRGSTPWLLLWGPGAPARADVLRRHVAAGGRAVVLDLSYWNRQQKARVSFDAPHPSAWVMRKDLPRTRFDADPALVANAWKETGPVIIAGLGDKARVQYGAGEVDRWEASMAQASRARWPKRPILYRKKKPGSYVPGWATSASALPIDDVLRGASLVMTWHSNVAVDAIRMGIPVICQDGAAAAVCPSVLGETDPRPLSHELRLRFLGNLAWYQWAPEESREFWAFISEQLS